MDDTTGDDLITRLIGAAVGDTEPGDKTAMVVRLFATLPPESQERLLRELLDQLGSEKKKAATSKQAVATEPAPPMRRPGPPFMWESMDDLPFHNIGPWQMCCRMMEKVYQAETVDDVDAELPAEVFGALGDETRIKIIRLLQDDERQADDIARTLDIPRSTLSHHLRVLRDAGLIQIVRRGRGSFCSLTKTKDET